MAKKEKTIQETKEVLKKMTEEVAAAPVSTSEKVLTNDHTTIVIPYSKSIAKGKELLYALRSWAKHLRFGTNIVVIGDREDWFSEEILFIPHESTSDNPWIDRQDKLHLAISSPDVTERFVWAECNTYLVNPISLAHIELPKVLSELNPAKCTGINADCVSDTILLLKNAKLASLDYDTGIPVLFEKQSLGAMFERFPELASGAYQLTSVYFNSLQHLTMPVALNWQTDSFLLPIVSQRPNEAKVDELLAKKTFLHNAPQAYSMWFEHFLDKLFPEKSELEE